MSDSTMRPGSVASVASSVRWLRQRAVADDGGRGVGGQAMGDHLAADFTGGADAHVEDDGLAGPGEGRPVEIDGAVLEMAGDEGDGLRVVAVGERKARVGGAAGSGGDAGDDFEGDAGSCQNFQFLAATPEDEGVAAFEADNGKAFARQVDQQPVDRLLRQGVVGGFLADIDAACVGTRRGP